MTHTTQHNAATLHAALMAAATLAPEYQNNEIGKASRDVSNASQLRAVYFDDGLIDRIQYAQRMGWKETQGEWLIQTTMEETYSELAATCDQRPSHVTVKTATGRLKLVNTRNRLQGFADEVARSKASWALWGGGNMPAELAKPRKAKPTTTWHTTSINVCIQCFEDKQFSDGLAMALGKLGAVAYWHQDNPKNEPFLMLAPQPVEGMPARLVSGRHAIGGEWVVFDTVSGYSIKGYKAARSRAAAERAAIDAWKEKTPAQIDAALNRVTANDTTKALARLCELWKVEDAAEALADAQAKAEALAADAVADTVAALVADAVAAVAIDAAQTTARADELSQVATVADEVACMAEACADAVAADVAPVAPVADAPIKTILGSPWQKATGTRDEWNAIEHKNAKPLGFYADLMACIKQAQASGLFYNSDVYPKAAELMAAMGYEDAREATAEHSVNSVFGSHCYLAGSAIRTLAKQQADKDNLTRLAPFVGQELGTLVFIDHKRTTNVTITEFDSDGLIKFSGKRGAQKVYGQADATALFNAINRAHERKQRKDNADTFKAHTPSNAADAVAEVVADALAAAAIETAQTTACADELAQVATVADAVACVADELACVADELACVADAVACMPRSEHCGQPPSHTPTGAGFATPGSSQPTASQAGKSGGQRIAGKSGKWVATFHTTPAGLPGMVYTDADGQAQAHEFASGAERMATLQRLARMADAQPATAANVAHLAAFDPSGVDVWQCSTREVQAMAEADFVALVQHLENVNHHTAALCAKCLRAGCDDLAEACTRLENAHVQAGQLTPALALARFTIGRLLRGESVNMAEAGAGSGLDACEVSEAVALVGNAYPPTKAAATPHTPPASAADAQATPPVCAADAPDYTHPLKTLPGDYTDPLKTLGALQITLTRGEGPSNECGKPQTVDSFDAADAVLQNWSRNAPEHGGYDKCDFLITWPDGDTYSGRYDLKHYRTERPSLARHMVDMVDFYTGKGCPAHMSEAAYTNHLNRIDADTRQAYETTAQRLNAAGIHTGKARPVSVDLRELVAMGMPVADLVGLGVTYCGDSMSEPEVGAIVEAEAVAKNDQWHRVGLMGNPGPAALAKVVDVQVTIQTETGATYTAWHDDFSGRTGARYRLDMKRHGAPYLAQLAAAVAMRTAQATAAKELEAKAHADELARLAVEFAHLERRDNTHGGGVFAARNMRTELKRAFPGVKFSVKSDYSSVDVRWTDGPTDAQVGEVIGRFDIGASDSQSDYFYTISTAFSELFGGVQYLNTHRETSDAFTAEAIAEFWAAEFADVANAPAMPTAEDWRKNTGFFDWRADNWQTRNFRDHLAAKAGPLPATAKATRKAKA